MMMKMTMTMMCALPILLLHADANTSQDDEEDEYEHKAKGKAGKHSQKPGQKKPLKSAMKKQPMPESEEEGMCLRSYLGSCSDFR